MATPAQIQEVARHFVIAALWADAPEGTHPRSTHRTDARAFTICKLFIDLNHDLYNEAMERCAQGYGSHPDAGSAEAAFGHDLWLTLRGHGVGFWDRDELDADDLGQRLTDACRKFGEPYAEFYRGWMHLHHNGI